MKQYHANKKITKQDATKFNAETKDYTVIFLERKVHETMIPDKDVEKKKSVAGQFAFKTTSSIGQKHLAGQKTKQERLLVILSG